MGRREGRKKSELEKGREREREKRGERGRKLVCRDLELHCLPDFSNRTFFLQTLAIDITTDKLVRQENAVS